MKHDDRDAQATAADEECEERPLLRLSRATGLPVFSGTDPLEVCERMFREMGWGELRLHGVSAAEFRKLVKLGWRPPDNRYSAGAKEQAEKAKAIADARRLLVKQIFDRLPAEIRRHPYANDDQAVRAIHECLTKFAAHCAAQIPAAADHPLLRNLRKVKRSTIRNDLTLILRRVLSDS
jgi:hypothetical protein